jgi:hypothetical protein
MTDRGRDQDMQLLHGRKGLMVLAVLLLAVAACGETADDGSGAAEGEETSAGGSAQAAMDAFTACMRDQGIDMQDQDVADGGGGFIIDGGGADDATMQAAMDACGGHLDDVVGDFQAGQDLDPEEQERIEESAMAFAQCMRDHGVDWPDPDVDGGGMQMGGGPGGDIDMSDAAVQSALQTCQDESGLEIQTRGSN